MRLEIHCCALSILDPLAFQKAHFNFSYGICETLVATIKKKKTTVSHISTWGCPFHLKLIHGYILGALGFP